MTPRKRSTRGGTWIVVLLFAAFVALVIYRSLYVAGYQCEVCISFADRSACRTVEGPTEMEARAAAINNTCAQLASGVTDTMACERTNPSKIRCAALQ